MKLGRNLKLSLRAITRSWLRTALSISGVAVGIASVVILIGAGVGAERALLKALEPLGHNLLVVTTTRTETSALRGVSRERTTLDVGDWKAIEHEVPDVLRTAPGAERPMLARFGGRALPVRVLGTTAEFAAARSFPLIAGRFIDDDDLADVSRVAVVGALVVEELFDGESPLGERLILGGAVFRIVGVAKKKGVSAEGAKEDELVFIPLTAAFRRLMDVDSLSRVYVQTTSAEALPAARETIAGLLRERHAIAPGTADDFAVQDQTAIVRAQQAAGGAIAGIVPWLCALALGLGGVGLLAVSLLSVRERYAEIGLRMAVGGRPRDILLQFLTEAVLISALGGLAGLGVGAAGILFGTAVTRWPMVLSWEAVVFALSISLMLAVVFGAYPALRAARLDPILALNSK